MRIVIDLQGAQSESRFRGIGRYSLSLALAMARNAGDHRGAGTRAARLRLSGAALMDAHAGVAAHCAIHGAHTSRHHKLHICTVGGLRNHLRGDAEIKRVKLGGVFTVGVVPEDQSL